MYFQLESELILLVCSSESSEERPELPIPGAFLVTDQPPLAGLGAALVEESVVAEEDSLALEEETLAKS